MTSIALVFVVAFFIDPGVVRDKLINDCSNFWVDEISGTNVIVIPLVSIDHEIDINPILDSTVDYDHFNDVFKYVSSSCLKIK